MPIDVDDLQFVELSVDVDTFSKNGQTAKGKIIIRFHPFSPARLLEMQKRARAVPPMGRIFRDDIEAIADQWLAAMRAKGATVAEHEAAAEGIIRALESRAADKPADDEERAIVELIADSLTAWDITKNGEAYAVTFDNIAALPYPVLRIIWGGIWDYHIPK